MAHKIIWSTPALLHLKSIAEFISRDSERYAGLTISKIIDSVERLATFPMMGRRVPEKNQDDYREILVKSWRIVYQVRQFDIEIMSVVHGAQRWSGGDV